MTKHWILVVLLGLAPTALLAAEEPAVSLEPARVNLDDTASLQRGAKYFVNYCMSCHQLKYVRFKRVAADLGIQKAAAKKYLVLGSGASLASMMDNAMPEKKAGDWFGKAPPDLSVIARRRGADWIYNYLQSFYLDSSRPTGTNNLLLKNAAMPDVLWRLQGLQRAQFETVKDANGEQHKEFHGFEQATDGTLKSARFDQMVRDITAFLVYVGEPAKLVRYDLGWAALIFILVLTGLAYMLKRDIWRDVHGKPESDTDGESGPTPEGERNRGD